MDRALLKRGLAAAVLGVVAACALYNPTVPDCSVTCGAGDACPSGTRCQDGFCRAPGAEGTCECRRGDERACGGGLGECVPGVQRCGADGKWGQACVGEGRSAAETCDNRDNDCDGVVDNAVVDALACSLTQGVCAGKRGACDAGVREACTTATYGPAYEALEEACDGLDNDCDGLTDVTQPVALATDVDSDRWALLGYDGGFALAYARDTDAGSDVVVARFGPRWQPLGAPVEAKVGRVEDFSARNVDTDVVAVWVEDGGVWGLLVGAGGMTRSLLPVLDAGYTSDLRLGAGQAVVATWYAESYAIARLAKWSTATSAPEVVDLNRGAGGALTTASLYSHNVSQGGTYALYSGEPLADAGSTATLRPIIRTSDLVSLGTADFFGGVDAVLLERDGGLTSVYSYSSFVSGVENFSGIYYVPELLTRVPELAIVETQNSLAWGPTDAVELASGQVACVFLDNLAPRLMQATASGSLVGPTFRQRPADPVVGTGTPHVAVSGPTGLLGLAWRENRTVRAVRACTP